MSSGSPPALSSQTTSRSTSTLLRTRPSASSRVSCSTACTARMASQRQTDLRVVAMPSGRDPAEIVTQDGAAAFRRLLESALNVWSFQLTHSLDQADLSTAEGRDRALAPTLTII